MIKPGEVTTAKILKQAGYSTACVGKWGIGHPPPPEDPHDNGFDYFFGYLSMWHAHNFYPDFLWKNGKKLPLRNVVQHPKEHYKANQENLVGLASEKVDYSHDLFSQAALEFIEEQNQPFFLFVSYTIPHANNEAGQFGEHGMEVPDYNIYIGEEENVADVHPDIVARAKELMDKVRTDADIWPLKDKAGKIHF